LLFAQRQGKQKSTNWSGLPAGAKGRGIQGGPVMMLRDHPLMSYHGVTNWPPMWTQGIEKNKKIVRDEVGILRYVHDVSPRSKKIYLVIEYEREHYVGTLIFDDIPFRHQITNLLQQNIGRPIEEIGDLDLSHML
jgi:hypothetical protein